MIQPKVKIDKKKKEDREEKIVMGFIYLVLAFVIIVMFFAVKSIFFPRTSNDRITTQVITMQIPTISKMSLTGYDKELAKKFMDKNNDGRCDACGMSVEQCIDSGQIQCNMDSKATIGILDSQHIHADWKIYINGNVLSFEGKDHMGRMRNNLPVSSFIHVDSGAHAPEKTGDILHMHATGVPLWIFFNSIGLELPSEMKAYVNGKEISDYSDYVFEDLDKILITDGKRDLQKQIDSVTDFAKNH